MEPNNTSRGTIKWYIPEKGYGIIASDDGEDVFVHRNSVSDPTILEQGQKVSYEVFIGLTKMKQAKNVQEVK